MKINGSLYGFILFILFCFLIALFMMGILTISDIAVPVRTKGFVKYDFTEGWFFLFSSTVMFFLMMLFLKYFESKEELIDYSKCSQCKISYRYMDLEDGICPSCNIKTIEIEKYYKKYPQELDDV